MIDENARFIEESMASSVVKTWSSIEDSLEDGCDQQVLEHTLVSRQIERQTEH